MDATTIMAISEIAKLGLVAYMTYMQQAGLTTEQIDTVFKKAKAEMLLRDPANIPSA